MKQSAQVAKSGILREIKVVSEDTAFKNALDNKKIVIMAGGTGGHIFPALAVGDKLKSYGANIFWLGTEYGLESKIVTKHYPIDYLSILGVRKKGLIRKLTLPFSLAKSVFQAIRILKKRKAKVVIGFGGYASAPGGFAAKILRIPLIVHEQNAKAGVTNKSLAKIAKSVLCAFPTSSFGKTKKLKVIGNPVREEICQLQAVERDFYKHRLNVLILGGSQGAKAINDVIPALLKQLPEGGEINIWHQCGERAYEEVCSLYQTHQIHMDKAGENEEIAVKVEPFIEDMAKAYRWADIAVCRSGALTVSELAAAAVPAFFIPFPYAVDDHQFHNAQFLVKAKAAECMRQEQFSADKLAAFIRVMDLDRKMLASMSEHAKGVAHIDATEKLVLEVVKWIK